MLGSGGHDLGVSWLLSPSPAEAPLGGGAGAGDISLAPVKAPLGLRNRDEELCPLIECSNMPHSSRDRKRCQPGIRRRYFHDPSSARPGKPRVFGFRGEYGCKAET